VLTRILSEPAGHFRNRAHLCEPTTLGCPPNLARARLVLALLANRGRVRPAGTTDGWELSVFNKQCTLIGPTVTVMESFNGYVFGGVTSASWEPSPAEAPSAANAAAFLFGIQTFESGSNPVLFNLVAAKAIKAMQLPHQKGYSGVGPGFGDGDLVCPMNPGDVNNEGDPYQCYAVPGTVYTHAADEGREACPAETKCAQNYFTGSSTFDLKEVEVFKLVPPPVPWGASSLSVIFSGVDGARAAAVLPAKIQEVVGPEYAPEGTTWRRIYQGAPHRTATLGLPLNASANVSWRSGVMLCSCTCAPHLDRTYTQSERALNLP
jgi:hypothetical protein